MYISLKQIRDTLPFLRELNPFFGMSYLAFKKIALPVGTQAQVNFSQLAADILHRHYRPTDRCPGFYNPFDTSNPQKRWLSQRYGSTSLQRITTDTFRDALIHRKNTSRWGWQMDYVRILESHLHGVRIPAFHLAAWLFRDRDWGRRPTGERVRNYLYSQYQINGGERKALFDENIPALGCDAWSERAITEDQFLDAIGWPPGVRSQRGAALRSIRLTAVGPTHSLEYFPADRLNIITGDNSLGKTFLLECIWWALTGSWYATSALPRRDVPKTKPRIEFSVAATGRQGQSVTADYDWLRQVWRSRPKNPAQAGLVVYARFDGSFAIWDPAKAAMTDEVSDFVKGIRLSPGQIWTGKAAVDLTGKKISLCNGVYRDWVAWQTGGDRYESRYKSFVAALTLLSPPGDAPLVPGEPVRMGLDASEMPTLNMPYGPVPMNVASAGVQRVVALAYAIVWAWTEHLAASDVLRQGPERRCVILVDEVEAHLHPRWQRAIVPALLRVIEQQSLEVSAQLHIATHSPMVLTSVEEDFDESRDSLHHLRLRRKEAILETLPFIKRGRADKWLTSDVIGLTQARSLNAEVLLGEARKIQLSRAPKPERVRAIHEQLLGTLAPDDEFWPTWCFFAEQHGVEA